MSYKCPCKHYYIYIYIYLIKNNNKYNMISSLNTQYILAVKSMHYIIYTQAKHAINCRVYIAHRVYIVVKDSI